tara:strand:- start:98 stop:214 length:117 start_codon:yes stop_codon:yes gene_type:complete
MKLNKKTIKDLLKEVIDERRGETMLLIEPQNKKTKKTS